jgi:hypothetical protein
MSFWRAAGLNYVQYSNIAARCVRAALKKDLQVTGHVLHHCQVIETSLVEP